MHTILYAMICTPLHATIMSEDAMMGAVIVAALIIVVWRGIYIFIITYNIENIQSYHFRVYEGISSGVRGWCEGISSGTRVVRGY